MKSKAGGILALIIWLAAGCKTTPMAADLHLYDLQGREVLSTERALQRLKTARFVLVGEHHNNADHHRAQLRVIQALHNAGLKVVIGLEMFRSDSQDALDRWVSGKTGEAEFKPVYLDNWNYDWQLYRPVFTYARERQIPMVGLNVSRKITAQVAYHGFESLNEEQRGALEGITCDVTDEYRDFIHRAYGAHGHGSMNFNRFCEAQLVWDTAMAVQAIDYVKRDAQMVMVILAGSGHARKLGIPAQLARRTSWPNVVILPETRGVFEAHTLSVEDADFIALNPK